MGFIAAKNAGKRALRGMRDVPSYARYLKNWPAVCLSKMRNGPLPPLEFRNGFTWHHGPYDEPLGLFKEIFVDRFYEPLKAPPGSVVLDIGANIGAVTLFWAQANPGLRFHAFEPNPQCFAALLRNIDANSLSSQVTAYPEAIGAEEGVLDLWVNVPTTLSTAYGAAPAAGAVRKAVPMTTLDEAWSRIGRPPISMLKIDTEGAEGDILEAASDELLRSVQSACVEWHDNIVPGVFERCRKRLEDAGFRLRMRPHPWDEGIIFADRSDPIASSQIPRVKIGGLSANSAQPDLM